MEKKNNTLFKSLSIQFLKQNKKQTEKIQKQPAKK